GYVCLKKKHLSEIKNKDTGRVICIVCHEEAKPEDFVSPLCRQMHFVLCRECIEYLKKRTNKKEVFCPYCKEKKSDKAYQEEILGAVLSLMSQHTTSLELRTDTEVETVTRLTRETNVILSNTTISDALFFRLMARAVVEIRNRISLVGHDDTLDWCIGELDWRTKKQARICFDNYTNQEMNQIHENIETIPRRSIQINAGEIHAVGDGVYFLLKAWAGAGECSLDLFLRTSKKEHIEGFLEEENSSLWVGKVKTLKLEGYAVEILPKLWINEENVMKELALTADEAEHITEILKTENNSVWVGRVKSLKLKWISIQTLPKLRIHEENVMKEFCLSVCDVRYITEILKTNNNSIWVER
ncbi:MAG: uncharacterized protein A8A55_3251, partial [Amphiamblys sp. WSBS2006]